MRRSAAIKCFLAVLIWAGGIFFTGSAAVAGTCAAPPSGLVSWWPGDGNTKDIVSGYDGSFSADTYSAGMVGPSFSFDGASAVTIPHNSNLNPLSITVEAWLKTSSGPERVVVEKSHDNTGGWVMEVHPDGRASFAYFNGDASWASNSVYSVGTVDDNNWHHVAATLEGTAIKIYIDGALNNAAFYSGTPIGNARAVNIGKWFGGGGGRFFTGLIDEVGIFSRALTAPEIAAIYNAGTSGKCKPCVAPPYPDALLAWWAGEDNAQDMQGNNPGTIVGATFADGYVGRAFDLRGGGKYIDVNLPGINTAPGTQVTVDFRMNWDGTFGTYGVFPFSFEGYGLCLYNGYFGFNTIHGDLWGMSSSGLENKWVQVAAIFNNGDAHLSRLFIDGVEQTLVKVLDPAPNPGQVSSLGSLGALRGELPAYALSGLLDEVQVYNRALTSAEISTLHNAGSGGVCTPCTAPPSDMVSWWKGDGNPADAVGTNHGTLQGGAGFAPGKVGQAFDLNGAASAVTVPADSAWAFGTADFTIDFWVYSASFSARRPLINNRKNGAGDNMWAVEIYGAANMVEFHSGSTIYLQATNPLINSSWNHVVVTRSAGALSLYVNGVLSGSAGCGGNFSQINELQIGRDIMEGNNLSGNFQGLIDEIGIFSRALSASEITAIYNAGCAGKCFASDTIPDAISFVGVTGADTSTLFASNLQTISGINVPVTASITAGSGYFSVNGGTCDRTSATVVNGNTVAVCLVSSAAPGTSASTTINVGTGSPVLFTVTTRDPLLTIEGGTSTAAGIISGAGITDCQVAIGGETTPFPCSSSVVLNTPVALKLSPASVYATWTGCGSSTETSCDVTVSADLSVKAKITEFEMKRTSGPAYHHKVQEAFNAVSGTDTLQLKQGSFDESLTGGAEYSKSGSLLLRGGHQALFAEDLSKFSAITPGLTLNGGPVTVENIIIW